MDLSFTETQTMVKDTLSRYLLDNYDFEKRRKMLERPEGRDPGVWAALANELGLLGASFSEELGGFGGGALENQIIMEELGGSIAVEPYVQTVILGGGALKHTGGAMAEAMIADIVEGKTTIAFAHAEPQGRYNPANIRVSAKKDGAGYVLSGHKAVVYAAPWASHYLVSARTGGSQTERDGVSLFMIDASLPGIVRDDYPTVDGFMASEIYFENTAIPGDALIGAEGGAMPLIEQIIDEATVGVCAEACGVIAKLHTETQEYTQQRKQFGQPISRFQVLQHRMVDMFMEIEESRSMTLMATLNLGEEADKRMAAVSMCKTRVSRACNFNGQNAVQTHGGMGITDELAVGHYFKRATMIENQFGSADYHLGRFERLSAK